MKGFTKVIIGGVATLVIALAVRLLVFDWYMERTLERSHKAIANMQANSQRQHQAIKDRQEAEQEAKRTALLQQQQAQAIAAKAAADKERAWNEYYKEPKDCTNWQTDKHMVECVNRKMRERKKFDERWNTSNLRTPPLKAITINSKK